MDPTEQEFSQSRQVRTRLERMASLQPDLAKNATDFVLMCHANDTYVSNIYQIERLSALSVSGSQVTDTQSDFMNGALIAFSTDIEINGDVTSSAMYSDLNALYTDARELTRKHSNNISISDVNQHRVLRRQIADTFNHIINSDPAFADIDNNEADILYDMHVQSGRNAAGIYDILRGYRMVRNVGQWRKRQNKIRSITSLLSAPTTQQPNKPVLSTQQVRDQFELMEQDWSMEPCDTEIAFLHTRLMYHIDALPHDIHEVSIIDDVQAILAEELADDLNLIPTLKLRDRIKVVGNTVCLIVKDDSLETVYFVPDSSSIGGELAELDVMSIPSQYAVDKGIDDHERNNPPAKVPLSMMYSMVMKLDKATIVKADGFLHEISSDVDCYVATDYNGVHVYHSPPNGTLE